MAYHRVVPDFAEMRERVIPPLLTSVQSFERQLQLLARTSRFVSLGEALDVLAGRATTTDDLCVVTFDDAYADFGEHALPVLTRLGVPAVLYVPTASLDGVEPLLHDRLYHLLRIAQRRKLPVDVPRGSAIDSVNLLLEHSPRSACVRLANELEAELGEDPRAALADSPLLTWDGLRAVERAGIEIGAHTVDHMCLHHEPRDEVLRQVGESKERLERELGTPVRQFAYPNGWYTPAVVGVLRELGFASAVTTEDGHNRLHQDPYALKRKMIWEFTSRGLRGFSEDVAACNFSGAFASIGLANATSGAKSDPV